MGQHIAKKIEEILKIVKLKYHQKLKKWIKIDLEQLKAIPNLGIKKIKVLYKQLKIKNISDLEKAIKKKQIQKLTGFAEKTEQLLSQGIELLKSKQKRYLYSEAKPYVNQIKRFLQSSPLVERVEIAGSFRRKEETIGDLDFLVISTKAKQVIDLFTKLPNIKKVLAKGTTKSSLHLKNGLQVDLRVVKKKEYGSALLYFTGNKQHNITLRKLALSKGYTLSEYGLFRVKEKKWLAGRTEEEIYKKLGLNYIKPEIRKNRGEIKAAQK